MIQFRTGEWENLDELDSEKLLTEIRPDAERAMKEALVSFEGIIKKTLTGRRSGRTYKVSRTGALHVASAPGEPPAVLFGNLRNSVGHSSPAWKGAALEGEVGPGLGAPPKGGAVNPEAYAIPLEFGSASGNLLPRPYMEPSSRAAEPVMDAIFQRWLEAR